MNAPKHFAQKLRWFERHLYTCNPRELLEFARAMLDHINGGKHGDTNSICESEIGASIDLGHAPALLEQDRSGEARGLQEGE